MKVEERKKSRVGMKVMKGDNFVKNDRYMLIKRIEISFSFRMKTKVSGVIKNNRESLILLLASTINKMKRLLTLKIFVN